VTASYLLSEDGRKASLLAGGDVRAVQNLGDSIYGSDCRTGSLFRIHLEPMA
jgi:hypothetical protein